MGYEEKYKEALERAEEIIKYYKEHNRGDEAAIEDFETIFPELAESEDDRIRKEITDLIMRPTWQTEKEFNRRKELAVWLEKQVEQKPAWSEEDELKRSTLIHVVKKQRGSAIFEGLLPVELIDWLKSLKQRIGG